MTTKSRLMHRTVPAEDNRVEHEISDGERMCLALQRRDIQMALQIWAGIKRGGMVVSRETEQHLCKLVHMFASMRAEKRSVGVVDLL
jgi:hypothetical protein